MEEEENIEVTPSEESGNIAVDDIPSEQPDTETPSEDNETETTEQPAEPAEAQEPELYELPGGRKVTAEELYKEHTENLLPEFTRRSQELAQLKKGNETINQEKPYTSPDWQPQSWQEAIELAKKEALSEIEARQQAEIEQRQQLEESVKNEIAELKKVDPQFNENAVFMHANSHLSKYGVRFPNLKSAYQHMKDTTELTKKVQKTTADNITKRNDPVSMSPGATGQKPEPSQFGNALEYFRSLNKQ